MITRIISALLLLPILLYILIYGGILFYIGVLTISVMALKEFYYVFKEKDICTLNIVGYFLAICITTTIFFKFDRIYLETIFFSIFIILCILAIMKKCNIIDISITFFGVLYIPYLLNYLTLIINSNVSIMIWVPFVIGWMSDTCAYFTGVFFGKNKLIPSISPKKTIEGSIGGIIGAMISCAIFAYMFKFNVLHMFILGAIGSVISQLGDLFASSIKRYLGVKDYGKLIPGHGGILDRFDSIIFTAPLVYYYVSYFLK